MVMYIRRLLLLIRFRKECSAIARELTHPGAVLSPFAHVNNTSMYSPLKPKTIPCKPGISLV